MKYYIKEEENGKVTLIADNENGHIEKIKCVEVEYVAEGAEQISTDEWEYLMEQLRTGAHPRRP